MGASRAREGRAPVAGGVGMSDRSVPMRPRPGGNTPCEDTGVPLCYNIQIRTPHVKCFIKTLIDLSFIIFGGSLSHWPHPYTYIRITSNYFNDINNHQNVSFSVYKVNFNTAIYKKFCSYIFRIAPRFQIWEQKFAPAQKIKF